MRNINLRFVEETYDEEGLLVDFAVKCPAGFNFGYDVVDDIAENDPDRRAMVWCNPEGEEHVFTFADMKRWSDKTANYLAAHGVGRGDYVMVILRRHYQFWFVATALAKLGAVMVPATFMLKEHDLEYRLNGASIKAIIATSLGDIADVVDNVAGACPTLEVKMLVNGAGGGLTPEDADGAARAVANSPLVKTAVNGHDANWGRIAMAVGKSGAVFRQQDVAIDIMGLPVCRGGLTVPFDEAEALARFERPEVGIDVDLGAGDAQATVWTCDFTHDYITINGDYRT